KYESTEDCVENQLRDHLWIGLVVWTLLYCSDYWLTIVCARLYREGVDSKLVFEGSYELTPYYQRDIDSLRLWSPRFLWACLLNLGALSFFWWLTVESSIPQLYSVLLGSYLLVQLAVHKRHVHNLFLFRAIANTEAVRGRIEYARPFLLRQSSLELFSFAILFAVLFLLTESWFVLGGSLGCLRVAATHLKLAREFVREHAVSVGS